MALDEALNKLADLDPQQSQLIELRFFGRLSLGETAVVLGISPGPWSARGRLLERGFASK